MNSGSVSVRFNASMAEESKHLASLLNAPLLAIGESPSSRFLLRVDAPGVSLERTGVRGQRPLQIDFNSVRLLGARDPLRKAIGAGPGAVVDATAGWCTDASALAASGLSVIAIERDPLVAAIVALALGRCRDGQITRNLEIVQQDSVKYLAECRQRPGVVYLDPMFPRRNKSAAVKKPLAMLQDLVGPPQSVDELFVAAMSSALRRVVVKRPLHAAPLAPGRVGAIQAKMVRFDLYRPESG